MVKLQLKNKGFKPNEKWQLLYVLTEVFQEEASRDKPLLDSEVVKLVQEKYGLAIERRTVAKYRAYLTGYFGFRFYTSKKGHYIQKAPREFDGGVQSLNVPYESIEAYKTPFSGDQLEERLTVILQALRNEKELLLRIDHYLTGRCPEVGERTKKAMKLEKVPPITIKPKTFIVTPLRLFRFGYPFYLFAYCGEEKRHFIFLVSSLTKIRLSKKKPLSPPLPFDFDAFIQKQDFILTGPVDEDETFKTERIDELYLIEGGPAATYRWEGDKPAFGFLPQMIEDVYPGQGCCWATYDPEERLSRKITKDDDEIDLYQTRTVQSHLLRIELFIDSKSMALMQKMERECRGDHLVFDTASDYY